MHTPTAHELRTQLSRTWSRRADAYLADDPESEVDAIWFPPSRSAEQEPLALLHCEKVHPDTRRIKVKALRPGKRVPDHLLLPLEHIIPLTYSSLPPLSFASVASREPFFDLLGESEAYRIRCLAQVPAHLPVSPLKVARAIPGLHIVAGRKGIPGTCTGSFHWTPDGIRLEVEGHPVTGYPTESSVGLALAGCHEGTFGTYSEALSHARERGEEILEEIAQAEADLEDAEWDARATTTEALTAPFTFTDSTDFQDGVELEDAEGVFAFFRRREYLLRHEEWGNLYSCGLTDDDDTSCWVTVNHRGDMRLEAGL